jgi:hypothetical protein
MVVVRLLERDLSEEFRGQLSEGMQPVLLGARIGVLGHPKHSHSVNSACALLCDIFCLPLNIRHFNVSAENNSIRENQSIVINR